MAEEDENKSKPIEEEQKEEGKAAASEETSAEEEDVVVVEDEKEEESEEKPEQKKPEPKKRSKKKAGKDQKEYLPDFPFEFKTVIAVLLTVLAIVLIWCVIFHPAMRIDTIEVNGNYEFSDDEILQTAGYVVVPFFVHPAVQGSREKHSVYR